MRFLLLAALMLAGCIDTKACHNATAWKACAGETAQPGGGGSPPSIVELSLPTCTFADDPTVLGTMHITDPDGDAQIVKATFYVGARTNEDEAYLADAGRSGNDWSGPVGIHIVANAGAAAEGARDVRIKVTDRAGAQSVPYCSSLTVLK